MHLFLLLKISLLPQLQLLLIINKKYCIEEMNKYKLGEISEFPKTNVNGIANSDAWCLDTFTWMSVFSKRGSRKKIIEAK